MTWPINKASTEYTDQASDSIAAARADINQNIINVNDMIDHFDIANAVDGDIIIYNGSTNSWKNIPYSASELFVPLGAFVENTWSQDSYSVSDKIKFFRKCVLGGKYWNQNAGGAYVAAEPVYGSIAGVECVRQDPTLHTPPNSTVTASNINVILNNGQISNGPGSNSNNTIPYGFTTSYKWATYENSYIEFVAGTYKISFEHDGPEEIIPALVIPKNGARDRPVFSDFVIYNATDNVDIKSIADMTDFQRNYVYFTLTKTTRVEIYNRAVTANEITNAQSDVLQVNLYSAVGSLNTGYLANPDLAFFGTNNPATWSPLSLGRLSDMGNRYMKITKL